MRRGRDKCPSLPCAGDVLRCLEQGVGSMCEGELATLECTAAQAYGDTVSCTPRPIRPQCLSYF